MDVPGLCKSDIFVSRQNVITVVRGSKKKPYNDVAKLERNERKYGDFILSFRIPEIYERKWREYEVENGVLMIKYDKDKDEMLKKISNEKEVIQPSDPSILC
jgi:HSP20 family molecular chaperone IbpA